MILWEKSSLDDREAIFEFLYEFNPLAAENVMTAEVIAGAEKLSEAVAFSKMFDGMDSDLQMAAADSMQLEFFITGANVNKKMLKLFGEGDTGLLTRTEE